jgi:diguanylate cyclase (GGDEF)-like protein/putative nucleotidyltransferase with HDIG domain
MALSVPKCHLRSSLLPALTIISEKIKVNQFDLSNYNLPTKFYLSALLVLSIGALGWASLGFAEFSPVQIVILVVSIIITALITQQQFKVRKMKTTLSAKDLCIYWGVIWVGAAGGVFISLAASLAAYRLFPKDKKRWLPQVLFSFLSSFAAAKAFYLFLQNAAGFEGEILAHSEVELVWLIAGIGIMGAVQFAFYNLLNVVFVKFESEISFGTAFRDSVFATYGSFLLGLAVVIPLHFAFNHFGLMFGLVILPLTIFADYGFRVHGKTLELKTKEIMESSRIHLATVEALATAIDARDQVGVGHVRRTQIYAVGMGELLGLNEGEIDALRTGALLHDIGKLGVPDHILNKPGRLTPAEMEKMKIHSIVGASILEKINFPYPVVPTVKYHHEMWDGSGYPEGLKREEIPLTARILSVADAYDTLRGARPYRKAVMRDEARRFLLAGSNTQFDPKLIDIFLRNLRQFELQVEAEGLAYELDNQVSDLFIGEDAIGDNNQGYVEHIKRANREVFALYELARVFSASLNLQDTLSLFVQKISELMPFETCVVYLLDKTQEFAEAAYAEGENAQFIKGKRIKVGEGATGYVLKKRQAVYNINPALDFSFYKVDFIQEYKAMAALPLIANERLIGAISLYSCELENYEDEHMRLLETVSRIASDAISKSVYHAETETHALTDPMTNLPNARCLQLHYENEVVRAKRNNNEFQMIMLDLDGFKLVNDTFGHKVGDLMLREIAKVMRAQLREYDFLARYAGDEFVAIIPDTTNEAIQELCQRLEKAVCGFQLPVGDGRFTGVGVSIGSASYPKDGETLDQVIISADKEMYATKARRKQQHLNPIQDLTVERPFHDLVIDEESFVMELDESHIVSNALN